jgi:hypothetical protein
MHRVPDGVVIVTADMRISVALNSFLLLSPHVAMFNMMSYVNTTTLRGIPRLLASSIALRGIAE